MGREVHLIDRLALCDPLLARLPARREDDWRIAHYERVLPAGYVETFESGQNQLEDPNLALYYDKLRLIIRGDMWSAQRWQAIWKINTGQYDALLEAYLSNPKMP
jgi:arabinofuranosyltransferase